MHLTSPSAPKREPKHEPSNDIISTAAISSKSEKHGGPPEQRSGTAEQETVDQTPQPISTPSKKEESLTDLEQGFRSNRKEASEDGTGRSLPSVHIEETDTNTRLDATRPNPEPGLPLPNPNVDRSERISPHKRILATSSPSPISMRDHESKQAETPTRKRTKVIIRQTSRGWVEVDPEQEKELEEQKAEDAGAKGDKSPLKESVKQKSQPEEVRYEPKASTKAQWQAFASAELTARVASDFQVIFYH